MSLPRFQIRLHTSTKTEPQASVCAVKKKSITYPFLSILNATRSTTTYSSVKYTCITFLFLWMCAISPGQVQELTNTIDVSLSLRSGGAISGLVVTHNDHGLVIARDNKPYVFAWNELENQSAYHTMQSIMVLHRGVQKQWAAQDYFELGEFSLSIHRPDLADRAFNSATKKDRKYKTSTREAMDVYYRQVNVNKKSDGFEKASQKVPSETIGEVKAITTSKIDTTTDQAARYTPVNLPNPEIRERVIEAYYKFGEKVQEVMGKGVVLIETDHFLIWTDWEYRHRKKLSRWCEAMYDAMIQQFQLDPKQEVFLAKCPMYCWKTKARFKKFARYFDGYEGSNALGYTRSIEKNGHVHVVLMRAGKTHYDFDRFASTLVHEGTHAFIHRLYSNRLIPHWVNEGLADMVAERVLKDRCNNGENAALLANPYVQYDWPIMDMIESVNEISVEQYPLAHSLIAWLEGLNHAHFSGFIRSLKKGDTLPAALSDNFDGLTLEQLDSRWRSVIRSAQSLDAGAKKTTPSP